MSIKINKKSYPKLFRFFNKRMIVSLNNQLVNLYKIFEAKSLKKECLIYNPLIKKINLITFYQCNFNFNATCLSMITED